MNKHDPQTSGTQYLEDLATAYWMSEALFTAIEMDIFTLLEPKGMEINELAKKLKCPVHSLERFLHCLCILGLLGAYERSYYNTKISSLYLVKGLNEYQGDSILWRKYLTTYWQNLGSCLRRGGPISFNSTSEDKKDMDKRIRKYVNGMDNVARIKVKEMIPFFKGSLLEGELLDVGTGSGAIATGFLEAFPKMKATLLDIPEVLEYTQELVAKRGIYEGITYLPTNILEKWPTGKEKFNLIMLSNIVHAYSEEEVSHILKEATYSLKSDGFLVIHDFFLGHFPTKAALFDLNMFINTYNGKVFEEKWIQQKLKGLDLFTFDMTPLEGDTALIIASKNEQCLQKINIDLQTQLAVDIKSLGFKKVYPISTDMIVIPEWAALKCQFGCDKYGFPHCPPNSPTPEQTRRMLQDYSRAFLIEGEPPTRDFQKLILKAEKLAFKAGFYKTFAYWAGPCTICNTCSAPKPCKRKADARPSLEGSGIDVFETVKRAGVVLKTLANKDDFAKYFGLLLLE